MAGSFFNGDVWEGDCLEFVGPRRAFGAFARLGFRSAAGFARRAYAMFITRGFCFFVTLNLYDMNTVKFIAMFEDVIF